MNKPKLSVIIPSFNEAENLQKGALDQVISYLEKQNYSWELILSDDGSSDSTPALLNSFAANHKNVRVLLNLHRGKGPTVAAGMMAASGEWRLFTDFDQSTPLSEVEKFWPFVAKGHSVIIGSRALEGAKRDEEPFYRHLMGIGFNLLVQMLAVPGIYDTQCGFKLFSQEATEMLFPKLLVYGNRERKDAFTGAFDVELLMMARRYKYQIAEVPVAWAHRATNRVSPVKDSLRMLWDVMKIRANDLLGRY